MRVSIFDAKPSVGLSLRFYTMVQIHSAELWRYTLPLREPLTVPQGTLSTRQGLILVLTDNAENQGFGEIAPLPGLHKETLEEVEPQIISALQANTLQQQIFSPSVQCGIEMALHDLQTQHSASNRERFQPLNALISGTKDTIIARAIKAVQDGYTTLKIKVGRHSLTDDIANICAIREAVGSNTALRLDANRTWSLETAIEFGEQIAACAIQYIEEPCKHLADSAEFARRTGIRVALDETLYASNKAEFAERLNFPDELLAAYILKPSALGGIEHASNLAREANVRGADAIVSSVFESGVALRFYVLLQQAWNEGRTIPCGLDTFTFFDDDAVLPRFTAPQGKVRVGEQISSSVQLNPNTTTRIFAHIF